MKRVALFAFLFVGCATSPSVRESGHSCDEIHHLANEWQTLANYIHEHNDNGLDADEIAHVAGEEHRLMPTTKSVVHAAVNTGGEYAQLAGHMQSVLDELDGIDDDDDWHEDVKVIDKLVDSVDAVTHECDKNG
jgi:hypothetical protein